mmetsp:Transcript_34945/g.89767  ORF Transcript_34945/g.89767 Transcript_34945/m.89767 type:complete len:204 (-) Transcript_34945:242-853(-)
MASAAGSTMRRRARGARRSPFSRTALAGAATLALSLGCAALTALSFVPSAPPARPVAAVALRATATDTEAPRAAAKPKPKPKPAAKKKVSRLPPKPKVPVAEQLTAGIMAPVVVIGYAIFGEPFVGKVRGKGIGLHSQAITAFCQRFAIQTKKRQGFIKTAKKTGHDLGFLVPGGWWGNGLVGEQAMEWYKESGIDRWDVSNW